MKKLFIVSLLPALLSMVSGCSTISPGEYSLAAQSFEQKGQHDEAMKSARQSIHLDPVHAPGWYWLGVGHYAKNEFDEAIPAFKKVIELKPQGPQYRSSYNLLGWSYGAKGQYEEAITNFDEAIRLDPNYRDAMRGRGWAYSHSGWFDKAISDFDDAIALEPDNSDALLGRGWAYYYKGRFNKAFSDFTRAADAAKADQQGTRRDALVGKAFSSLGLGDGKNAVNTIETIPETDARYRPAYHLSLIYYAAGDKEKAWEQRGGRGFIGAQLKDYSKGPVRGAEAVRIVAGSPAKKAGIMAGDVLLKLNDSEVTGVAAFVEKTSTLMPGSTARIKMARDGREKDVFLEVGSAEALIEADPLLAPILGKRKGVESLD